jgi:hypothetical protein
MCFCEIMILKPTTLLQIPHVRPNTTFTTLFVIYYESKHKIYDSMLNFSKINSIIY